MATYSLFKTKKEIGDLQQVFEGLNKKFGEKYKVEYCKADSGVMKFLSGETVDCITIKKSAYHGVTLNVSLLDPGAGIDYQTISWSAFTPNTIVRQILGRTGIIDLLIARLIWGSGNEFYGDIENYITSDLGGVGVDTGLMNSAKQMMKGKSVLDD